MLFQTKRLISKMVWNGIPAYSIPHITVQVFVLYVGITILKHDRENDISVLTVILYKMQDKNAANLYAKYLCDTATPLNWEAPSF